MTVTLLIGTHPRHPRRGSPGVCDITPEHGKQQAPTVAGGMVYTGSDERNVYALDAATGVGAVWQGGPYGPTAQGHDQRDLRRHPRRRCRRRARRVPP
ncbi:PQQ-binding-like beta-propeller repeat protein [Embleya sp. NPDC127516]|uniref:PQQ-binding-like beta-propeller repeat protein n=1 Tax=Embleya sp. NPDC127516 TaxID=3363990 RepID=UPI0037FE2DFF